RCPAAVCQVPAPRPVAGAGPVDASGTLEVTRFEPPADAVVQAIALTRAASIDVGGVEYLVSRADGQIYFYDVNATSNFVADAPRVLGFDPFKPFVDFLERRATDGRATSPDTRASTARRRGARRPGRAVPGGR